MKIDYVYIMIKDMNFTLKKSFVYQSAVYLQIPFQNLILLSRIYLFMDVKNFLNPVEEDTPDLLMDIENQVLAQYGPEITGESDEEVEVAPRVSTSDALESLKKVQLFVEQQPESDQTITNQLSRLDWLVKSKLPEYQRQPPDTPLKAYPLRTMIYKSIASKSQQKDQIPMPKDSIRLPLKHP